MTDISTYGRAKGNSLVPLATGNGPTLLCASQDKIEIVFDDEGNAAIIQSSWPDEDQTILISRDNIPDFIDRLTDALGIPSIGGPSR